MTEQATPDYIPARGTMLDRLASLYGVKRERLWWTLWLRKERDASVRARCFRVIANVNAQSERP